MLGNSIEKLSKDQRLLLGTSLCGEIFGNLIQEQMQCHKDIIFGLSHIGDSQELAKLYREHAAKLEIWVSIQTLRQQLLDELNDLNAGTHGE